MTMRSMHVFAALLAACGLCGLAAAGCAKPPVVQDFDVTAYMVGGPERDTTPSPLSHLIDWCAC